MHAKSKSMGARPILLRLNELYSRCCDGISDAFRGSATIAATAAVSAAARCLDYVVFHRVSFARDPVCMIGVRVAEGHGHE